MLFQHARDSGQFFFCFGGVKNIALSIEIESNREIWRAGGDSDIQGAEADANDVELLCDKKPRGWGIFAMNGKLYAKVLKWYYKALFFSVENLGCGVGEYGKGVEEMGESW